MYRILVNSSNILSIGYDLDSKTLEVQFPGSVYEYLEVSNEDFIRLITAESHGTALDKFIKGRYKYNKLKAKI